MQVIRKVYRKIFPSLHVTTVNTEPKIGIYLTNGRIPWSEGYSEYKWKAISNSINNSDIIESFQKNNIPNEYGIGLDERIVEYPWIIGNLSNNNSLRLLDAGSTFNFNILLQHPFIAEKELCIYNYNPESENFNERRISYFYGDLRNIPFQDKWFDEIVCQSTIEHIGMDNSIYGDFKDDNVKIAGKNFDYLKTINELIRVLKPGGMLLLTFPFGKYENHGFFQQFDNEMLELLKKILNENGEYDQFFFRYFKLGWQVTSQQGAEDSQSYNPHSGVGKMDDGAAHCRAVCCIKFLKQ